MTTTEQRAAERAITTRRIRRDRALANLRTPDCRAVMILAWLLRDTRWCSVLIRMLPTVDAPREWAS